MKVWSRKVKRGHLWLKLQKKKTMNKDCGLEINPLWFGLMLRFFIHFCKNVFLHIYFSRVFFETPSVTPFTFHTAFRTFINLFLHLCNPVDEASLCKFFHFLSFGSTNLMKARAIWSKTCFYKKKVCWCRWRKMCA